MFRDSQVVRAYAKEGLSIQEVAALFGITSIGVEQILRRSLAESYPRPSMVYVAKCGRCGEDQYRPAPMFCAKCSPAPAASPTESVCRYEARIGSVLHVCNRRKGHPPPHILELFDRTEPKEPVTPTHPASFFAYVSSEQQGWVGVQNIPVTVKMLSVEPCVIGASPTPQERSGFCSAHRDGEDPACRICYPGASPTGDARCSFWKDGKHRIHPGAFTALDRCECGWLPPTAEKP